MQQSSTPSADDLTADLSPAGRSLSTLTRQLIALAPGDSLLVEDDPLELVYMRTRIGSNIKTARLHTGYRYRLVTRERRLYVVCEGGH